MTIITDDIEISYTAPPTIGRFMQSEAFGRLIAGPVGSGKTLGCIFELLRRSIEQGRAPDGFRYTRWAIVRQTLKQMRETLLKDIMHGLEGIVSYKVSEHTIYIQFGEVRSEWILIPLENIEDQRRLLSSQLTGAWINEGIEIDLSLIDPIGGRCGRFPGPKLGGCTWKGIIIDTNFPEEGSDWYQFMEISNPPDWQFFYQPGGLTPEAENLQWLNQTPETLLLPEDDPERLAQGRKYYERLAGSTLGPNWVKRYVHALFGDDPSGTAVFRDSFVKSFHVRNSIDPVIGHFLLIGQDFGRDPWSIICQPNHKGQLLVLDEVPVENMGLEKHIQLNLRPKLMGDRYRGRPVAVVGDPAGVAKDSLYEETSFDLLKKHGFSAYPAPTNDIDARLRACETWFLEQRGGEAALLIDGSRCPKLVRALSGGYKFARTRDGKRKALPEKDEFSHPVDALEYACLAALGGQQLAYITRRLASQMHRPMIPAMPVAAWT
jgi:hypothetical protein